jgi:hypothetical protein
MHQLLRSASKLHVGIGFLPEKLRRTPKNLRHHTVFPVEYATDTNLRSSEYQKKLKSSGSFAPQTPSQLRCSIWRCGGRPASAGEPPPAPSAWSRARTRATKSCGVRGSHFPALFDYFNLERNFVSGHSTHRPFVTLVKPFPVFSFWLLHSEKCGNFMSQSVSISKKAALGVKNRKNKATKFT